MAGPDVAVIVVLAQMFEPQAQRRRQFVEEIAAQVGDGFLQRIGRAMRERQTDRPS